MHMKNKEINLDTFSILNSVGWSMVIMRFANIISTPWANILNYWLALLGIGLIMGIVTSIIAVWASKGGKNSAQ